MSGVLYIYKMCQCGQFFVLIQLDLGFGLFGNSVQFLFGGVQSKQ